MVKIHLVTRDCCGFHYPQETPALTPSRGHAPCAACDWPRGDSVTYRHRPPLAPLLEPRVWPMGPEPPVTASAANDAVPRAGGYQRIGNGTYWQGKIIGNKSKKKPQIIIHEIHPDPLLTPYHTTNGTVTGHWTMFLTEVSFVYKTLRPRCIR